MLYLLFIFYLVIFCWLITRIKFFTQSGLHKHILIILFVIKVITGLISGYISLYYYQGTDIANFQLQGIAEYHLLFDNTREYFSNIFYSGHKSSYGRFLDSSDSYWNDTRSNLIIKMLSVFNIFSRTNFFINSLFYNFLIFFGPVALYKIFIKIFPAQSVILIGCIFLLPSVIYFSSSVHRDGLIYLSLCMVMYHVFHMVKTKHFSNKKFVIALLYLCLILLLRNFVFITLIPALIAWIISETKPKHSFIIFCCIYIVITILFFSSQLLLPAFDLPAHVSARQRAFIEIARGGASAININPLYPGFRSFFNNIPQALNHSLMRPYITEHLNFLYVPASIEILGYEIIFLIYILFRKKNITVAPIIYFCAFFSITMFLIVGYTIPIIGAIVRYRSIYFPLILIPVICNTDWIKVKKSFT